MPLEIRGAQFLIRSAQLVRGDTLRIGADGQVFTPHAQSPDTRADEPQPTARPYMASQPAMATASLAGRIAG